MEVPVPKPQGAGQEKSTPATSYEQLQAPQMNTDDSNGKPLVKVNSPYLDVPLQSASARSSVTISDRSIYSADNENERRPGRPLMSLGVRRLPSRSPVPASTSWKGKFEVFWAKNKGLALVTLAQLFGVMMNVTTRLLEMDGSHGAGMHPFQILFARMTGTLVLSGTYQWLARVEGAPFGPKEVRKLLIARGVGGFFGVYGMYCKHGKHTLDRLYEQLLTVSPKIPSSTFPFLTQQ